MTIWPRISVAIVLLVSVCINSAWAAPPLKRMINGSEVTVEPLAVYLGRNEARGRRERIAVVDFRVTNASPNTIVFDTTGATFTLNADTKPAADSLTEVRDAKFDYFGRQYRVRSIAETGERVWKISDAESPEEEPNALAERKRSLAPGEAHRVILCVDGFSAGQDRSELSVAWPGLSTPIDLTSWSGARADIATTRVGPSNCLGLIAVRGPVDRLGIHEINAEIERLLADDVRRAAICFQRDSAISEGRLPQWMRLAIQNPSTALITYRDLPTISPGMLSLVMVDEHGVLAGRITRRRTTAEPVMFSSEVDAIAASLSGVAARLSRDAIIDGLRKDQPDGVKTAYLKHGADRLLARDLPLVLELTTSESPSIRVAAIETLSEFSNDAAVDFLTSKLDSTDDLERATAVLALQRSRGVVAPATLDRLASAVAENVDGLRRLSKEPREAWRPVFEAASTVDDAELRSVAIEGLLNLGGDEAWPVIERVLRGNAPETNGRVISYLLTQNRTEWVDRAISIAVEDLVNGRADDSTIELLSAARRREHVTTIIEQLPKMSHGTAFRAIRLIGTLATDDEEQQLAETIPLLSEALSRTALGVLIERQSPMRIVAARRLIEEGESALARSVLRELGNDRSAESEQLILDLFAKCDDKSLYQQYASIIASIGGEKAWEVVNDALLTGPEEKQQHAFNIRAQLWGRSPADSLDKLGLATQANVESLKISSEEARAAGDIAEADELLARSTEALHNAERLMKKAVEVDPRYAPAYSNLGMLYLQWPESRLEDAAKAYQRGRDVAPSFASAAIGLALIYAARGEADPAIKAIEEIPDWVRGSGPIDEYNVACVYGILHAKATTNADSAVPVATAKELKEKALAALATSIDLGFRDGNHMRGDGDLSSLHGEEFEELLKRTDQFDEG